MEIIKNPSILILSSENLIYKIESIVESFFDKSKIDKAINLNQLKNLFSSKDWQILISFGTSVIVPTSILRKKNLISINIHAASPSYPGRDPHHFAVYDRVSEYGATMHFMSENVDEGSIIDVEFFDVKETDMPVDLLNSSIASGLSLLKCFLKSYKKGNTPKANLSYSWNGKKRSRNDFVKLCEITPNISAEEFSRRYKACQMPGYQNLYFYLYKKRFILQTYGENNK